MPPGCSDATAPDASDALSRSGRAPQQAARSGFGFERWGRCRLKRGVDRRGIGWIQGEGGDLRLRSDSWSRGLPDKAW